MDRNAPRRLFEAVAIGGSAGSFDVLPGILAALPAGYPLPVVVALHVHPEQDGSYLEWFCSKCRVAVKEAEEKEPLVSGWVYFAPPNYHLLVEPDRTLALSVDNKVQHSRPSIDVLLSSAADAYGPGLVGVVLTGANHDGAWGLGRVKLRGGLAVVQDPASAAFPAMPQAAMEAAPADMVLSAQEIGPFLAGLARLENSSGGRP